MTKKQLELLILKLQLAAAEIELAINHGTIFSKWYGGDYYGVYAYLKHSYDLVQSAIQYIDAEIIKTIER